MNPTLPPLEELADQLLDRVRQVQQDLGWTGTSAMNTQAPFSELLDSMGLVEFVLCLSENCGVTPDVIENCVERRFGTVWELAVALHGAGLVPHGQKPSGMQMVRSPEEPKKPTGCWLGATAVALPEAVQSATEINHCLQRPLGWLEEHAGIHQRRLWRDQDPLAAAAEAGRESLQQSGLATGEVGALLVTSEAPPLLLGLAAALHQRLGLGSKVPALEVGGACSGFLGALWLARSLLPRVRVVLMIAVEAPSKYLHLEPGPAGESAALFGDGAAACLVCDRAANPEAVSLQEVVLGADGDGGLLLQVQRMDSGFLALKMNGQALAGRALRTMAQAGRALLQQRGLALTDLKAVVSHGGNGRMPALLARQLGLPAERVWSETARTGNLGSASLPVAWAAHGSIGGPVLWTAVGAGLTWGTALTV